MNNLTDTQAFHSTASKLKTVFLDRDGVINRKMPEGQYVTSWEHFDLLPGVVEAIALLKRNGLRVLVVTNQRGIALGLYSVADVESIHSQLNKALSEAGAAVDGFYFCPHDKRECDCRKPLPGMFVQAQADFPEIEPETSVMIGDSLSDIEFGKNLGMATVFIRGNEEHQKAGASKAAAMAGSAFKTLPDAITSIFASI